MPVADTVQFKAMPGQVSIDEAKGIVECFVAGVGNKDSVGDIVLPGAFTESLKRRKPRVVWGHDWNHPIGKVLEIYEVPASDPRLPAKMKRAGIGGLFARVQFNLKSEKGKEAFANVAFYGEEQEWSIGYKTLDAIYDNQRQANLLREVELYEVSPVLHGANQLTGTISIKAAEAEKAVDSFKKSKWPMFDREFAERIKRDYPQIWAAGGNIKGNDQYRILTAIAEQGGASKSTAQTNALELREAWVARHAGDFRLPGVIAQIKWLAIGSRGEDYMKNVVREAMAKHDAKMKKKAYPMPTPDLDEEMDEEKGHGGMMGSMAGAIGRRFGGPVRIRHADSNMVVFDHMMDGKPHTMRVAYHFDGDEFMFGKPVGVKPTVVYMPEDDDDDDDEYRRTKPRREVSVKPGDSYSERYEDVEKPEYVKPKAGCSCGGGKDAVEQMSEFFDDAMKALDLVDAEVKAGRVISGGNLEKLSRAMELLQEVIAAGGRTEIEMKEKTANISANIDDLFAVKQVLEPVFEYHKLDATASEFGIEVKGLLSDDAVNAINRALSNLDYDAEFITEDDSAES
jgi:HK97 family phage prohead protease